ncbi:RNA polymerase sigma factor [Paractinoplanes lichenicola]|uniref:RNA polymerase sigma factor n=1 Tax=Paractinoplanes lichenicola TaxID=2802976 RepID=UPI0027DCB77C|nr:RNA polymerase sigma factor [Actinoplanes lichenicola]
MNDEERFRRAYERDFDSLLAFATRRVEQPADAADVVAETFLVAWRRRTEVPADDETRLWLYGVARLVLSNHHRAGLRRERLGARLRRRLSLATRDPSAEVTERLAVHDALARLGDLDREVLTLTVWEELKPREAAVVLGISAAAVRTRLSRARARVREILGDDPRYDGHVLDVLTAITPEEGR